MNSKCSLSLMLLIMLLQSMIGGVPTAVYSRYIELYSINCQLSCIPAATPLTKLLASERVPISQGLSLAMRGTTQEKSCCQSGRLVQFLRNWLKSPTITMKSMARKIVISFHLKSNLSSSLVFIFFICAYSTTEALTDSYSVDGIIILFNRYTTTINQDSTKRDEVLESVSAFSNCEFKCLGEIKLSFGQVYFMDDLIYGKSQELLLQLLTNYLLLGMYPQSSPLIITRKLREYPQGNIYCHYELGKMVHYSPTACVHQLRQLSSPLSHGEIGKQYLVRITQKKESKEEQLQQRNNISRQYSFLRSLNESHPKQPFLHQQAAWQDQKHYYELYQQCQYGTLQGLLDYRIQQQRPFKAMHILYYVKNILELISLFNQSKMIHGSVRCANLWLDNRLNLKLGGFENMKEVGNSRIEGLYSIFQMPPQGKNRKQLNASSDVWMLGILAYRMLTLGFPFMFDTKHNQSDIKTKRTVIQTRITRDDYKPAYCNDSQDPGYIELKEIIANMLTKRAQNRPSASKLLTHKIFEEIQQAGSDIRREISKENVMYLKKLQLEKTEWRFEPKKYICGEVDQQISKISKTWVIQAFRIEKYGFFFRLNSNSIIAYFNDHNIIKINQKQQLQKKSYSSHQDLNRYKILSYVYKNYFQSKIRQYCLDCQSYKDEQDSDCSLYSLFWHQNTLFVRLTNQTIQIFTNPDLEQTQSKSSPVSFNYYLVLNNSYVKPQQIVLHKNNRFYIFNNYQQAKQNSQSELYFNHIDKTIKLILDNSAISEQKCKQKLKSLT